MRRSAATALGKIGGDKAPAILRNLLSDRNPEIRCAALSGLAETCEDNVDQELLGGRYFTIDPLDPQSPITEQKIAEAVSRLSLPEHEIRRRYEALAQRFGLMLEWKPETSSA